MRRLALRYLKVSVYSLVGQTNKGFQSWNLRKDTFGLFNTGTCLYLCISVTATLLGFFFFNIRVRRCRYQRQSDDALKNKRYRCKQFDALNLAEVNHRLHFHTPGFTFSSQFPFVWHLSYCWPSLPLDSYRGCPWMQMGSFTNPVAVTWNTFSLCSFLITYRFLCSSHPFLPTLPVSKHICIIHLRPCYTD